MLAGRNSRTYNASQRRRVPRLSEKLARTSKGLAITYVHAWSLGGQAAPSISPDLRSLFVPVRIAPVIDNFNDPKSVQHSCWPAVPSQRPKQTAVSPSGPACVVQSVLCATVLLSCPICMSLKALWLALSIRYQHHARINAGNGPKTRKNTPMCAAN